jgi:hypothetical protein
MNRPVLCPHDLAEEAERLKEYASLLNRANHSDFIERGNPQEPGSCASLILAWQYEEGIIAPLPHASGLSAAASKLVSHRSELARRLARFVVARQAGMSLEYLHKLCREWERNHDPTAEASRADIDLWIGQGFL